MIKIDDINADDKKKKIISKEKMKELLGHSPDIMDNIEMRMYPECKKQGSKILSF